MDTRTGQIFTDEEVREMNEEDLAYMKRMERPPTVRQITRKVIDKYDPCPCGSGKKFKWCCWTGGK